MELLGLIVPFVAAGGWLWWIHHVDRFEKEPWPLVLKTAGLGAGAGLAALILELILILIFPVTELVYLFLVPVHLALLAATLYLLPYRRPEWNEPFDGVVYGGAAGIGYGLTFTLLALIQGLEVGFRSAVFSMPLYMLAGLVIGHHLSLIRFRSPHQAGRLWARGLVIAGLYLAGFALAQGLGGEVMGMENPLASAFVYAANTIGWVMAIGSMDAKVKSSQFHAPNYRIWLSQTGCHTCGTAYPVGANFCCRCGQPASGGVRA